MTEQLLPPRFLFRFSVPCRRRESQGKTANAALDVSHRLPCFDELDGANPFAEVRAAWSTNGMAFSVIVKGKTAPLHFDEEQPELSDGFSIWIDTRDTHTIHRASRFCHQFLALPIGGGPKGDQPVRGMLPIHRARDNPKPVEPETLSVSSKTQKGGYTLSLFVPAAALTGFDPAEHPRLGFAYLVHDSELGRQTFNCPGEFPMAVDPSLWGTLELVE